DRLAQLERAAHGPVRVILRQDAEVGEARRRALDLPYLGLALTQVAPVGVAVREPELHRLGHDVDHTHVRDRAEGSERVECLRGHVRSASSTKSISKKRYRASRMPIAR